MKVQVTESEAWRRTLDVEVPGDEVEKRFEAAYRSYSKSLNLPGFRKGKVPLQVVKKRFGKAIQGEVLQEAMQEFYREASRTEGLNPVSEATIEEVDFSEGQPLKFKASVDVKPTLDVQGYRGLKAKRPIMKVKDEHVEEHLQLLLNQNATEQVVERPLALGDVLVGDIQELDASGAPIADRKQEDRTFVVGGPNATNHDLDNQLVGISAGEERDVKLTRPEEDAEHGGEEIRFLVTAKEVRERTLGKLDDEFAKDMGDFESLDALKQRIREDFQARADDNARRQLEANLADALIDKNEFELPQSMVDNYLDNMVENYKREHADHDHAIDEEAIRKESQDGAMRNLKRFLLLEAVGKQEKIQLEEGDLEKRLEALGQQYGMESDKLRQV
ncbi:MAG: trigger factor, partial [bacterium]|nr:trigger factor [bacterium]